jgi:hypothetical protein
VIFCDIDIPGSLWPHQEHNATARSCKAIRDLVTVNLVLVFVNSSQKINLCTI